jgi:hypothetical protein
MQLTHQHFVIADLVDRSSCGLNKMCNSIKIVMLTVVTDYDYVFSENGLVAYENGKLIGNQVWISLLHYHHTWYGGCWVSWL